MITMTIEEVLRDAIEQINHLQGSITDLTREPELQSTKITIRTLEDAIKSPASQQVVLVNESNITKP
jgi:hypothetical protein